MPPPATVGDTWMQIHPPGFSATCLPCCPAQPSLHPCPPPGQAQDEAILSPAGVWWCQARSTSPSSLWLPQLPGSRPSWRLPPLPYTPRLLLLSLSSPALKAASPSPILTTTQTTQPHVRVLRYADMDVRIRTIKATVRLRPGKRMRTHTCEHTHRCTAAATHTEKACAHLGERQGHTGAGTRTPG